MEITGCGGGSGGSRDPSGSSRGPSGCDPHHADLGRVVGSIFIYPTSRFPDDPSQARFRALQALLPLIAQYPTCDALWSSLGLALYRSGLEDLGWESVRLACVLGRENPRNLARLSRCLEVNLERQPLDRLALALEALQELAGLPEGQNCFYRPVIEADAPRIRKILAARRGATGSPGFPAGRALRTILG